MGSTGQAPQSRDHLPEAVVDQVVHELWLNLRRQVGDRDPDEVAAELGISRSVLERALRRPRSLTLGDLADLEAGLGRLWPIRFDREEGDAHEQPMRLVDGRLGSHFSAGRDEASEEEGSDGSHA